MHPTQEVNESEIDKDTLLGLLKDKSKELKTVQTKLQKIEEKYVKVFKEHKNCSKDREVIEKIMKVIFNETDAPKFSTAEPGSYDYNIFNELWSKREDEKARLEANKRGDLESKITALQNRINTEKQQLDQTTENQLKSLKQRITELEGANSSLGNEITELNEIINKKNVEIEGYKGLESEVATMKAEILMKEFKMRAKSEKDLEMRFSENEKFNEMLKLKNELEMAYDKIMLLEKTIDSLQQHKPVHSNSDHKITSPSPLTPADANHNREHLKSSNPPSKPSSHTFLKEYKEYNIEQLDEEVKELSPSNGLKLVDIPIKEEMGRLKRSNSNPTIRDQLTLNQEYLKNVMFKYFMYAARNNLKEASILEQAICTILKMTKQEKQMIDEAKSQSTFWSSLFDFKRKK